MADMHIFKAISPEGELIEIQVEVPLKVIEKMTRRREIKSARVRIFNSLRSLINGVLTFLSLSLRKLSMGIRWLLSCLIYFVITISDLIVFAVRSVIEKIKKMPTGLEKGGRGRNRVVGWVLVILVSCLIFSSFILGSFYPHLSDIKWLGNGIRFALSSDKEMVEIITKERITSSGLKPVIAENQAEMQKIVDEQLRLVSEVAERRRLKEETKIMKVIEGVVSNVEDIVKAKAEEDRRKKEDEEINRPIIIDKSFVQAVLGYFLRDQDQAKNIDKCIELDPKNPVYRGWRILIRSRFNWKASEGFKSVLNGLEKEGYEQALTVSPHDSSEYFSQGVSYFRLGLNAGYYKAAIEDFDKCRHDYGIIYREDGSMEAINFPICYYFLSLSHSKLGEKEAADYNLQKFKVLEQRARVEIIKHSKERRNAELIKIRKQNGKELTKSERRVLESVEQCLMQESSCSVEEAIKTIIRTGKVVTEYLGWLLLYSKSSDCKTVINALNKQQGSLASQYLMQEALWYAADGELAAKALIESGSTEGLIQVALYAESPAIRKLVIEETLQQELFVIEESVRVALRKISMFDEDEANRQLAKKVLEEFERKKAELEKHKQLEEERKITEAAKITEQQILFGVNEKMMPQTDQGADLKTKKAQGIGLESSIGGDGIVIENAAWDHIQRAFLFCLKSSSGKSVDFDHGTLKIKGSIYRVDYPYKFSTSSFDNVIVNGCIIPTADFQQATWNHQEGRLAISLINYRHLFDGVSKIEYTIYNKKGHPFITLTAIPELRPCPKGETTTHTGYIICL